MFDWKRIRLIAGREVRTRVAMNSYRWSLIVQVLIVALIAALFGFGGIAGAATGIAQILFVIFLVLFVASLIFGRRVID